MEKTITHPDPTDASIINRILLGKTHLFAVLFDRYAKKVFGYLWHFSRNREDCEDFLQDTFYKAYVNLKDCRNRDKFSSWLFSIAHNVAISNSRKLSLARTREISEEKLPELQELASSEDINMEMIRQENRETIQKIFEEMPLPYRETTLLFYYNDLSLREISDMMEIPVNTVKTRLHRGRQFLGKRLREEARAEAMRFPLAHYPYH